MRYLHLPRDEFLHLNENQFRIHAYISKVDDKFENPLWILNLIITQMLVLGVDTLTKTLRWLYKART